MVAEDDSMIEVDFNDIPLSHCPLQAPRHHRTYTKNTYLDTQPFQNLHIVLSNKLSSIQQRGVATLLSPTTGIVGEKLGRRQKTILDAILLSAKNRQWTKVTDKMLSPKARYLSSPLCNVLQKEMEKKVVPGGNFVELLRNHEVIHYDCLDELFVTNCISSTGQG